MKALTVCQPYSHLIAIEVKPIENRDWYLSHRGELAIHAGKSRAWLDVGDEERYPDMPFGAIESVVDVVDCVRVENMPPELAANEHANGPFCIIVTRVRRLREPIPCKGALGLWTVAPDVEAQVRGQL